MTPAFPGSQKRDFFIYVDDVRITGPGEDEVWAAIRKLSSLFGYLGIQDSARKRRPPTTSPGAWAGSMVYVDQENVGGLCGPKEVGQDQVSLKLD